MQSKASVFLPLLEDTQLNSTWNTIEESLCYTLRTYLTPNPKPNPKP